MGKNKSKEFLEQSAALYHNTILKGWKNLYEKKREYLYNTLKKFHVAGKALELGCADGVITQRLCNDFESVTVVDGSKTFLMQVKTRIRADNLHLEHSLFEEYSPQDKFNTVFMTHILEHLDNPMDILIRCQEWLAPNGRVLIDVPNANSIHRQIGVKMGLLPQKDALNDQDRILGHKRVYTPELLKQHVQGSGLKIVHCGGIMIKPLSNRQIEEQWPEELIEAFLALGEDMPELCSEIYIVAEKP